MMTAPIENSLLEVVSMIVAHDTDRMVVATGAVIVFTFIDDDGTERVGHASTDSVAGVESVGMLEWAKTGLLAGFWKPDEGGMV